MKWAPYNEELLILRSSFYWRAPCLLSTTFAKLFLTVIQWGDQRGQKYGDSHNACKHLGQHHLKNKTNTLDKFTNWEGHGFESTLNFGRIVGYRSIWRSLFYFLSSLLSFREKLPYSDIFDHQNFKAWPSHVFASERSITHLMTLTKKLQYLQLPTKELLVMMDSRPIPPNLQINYLWSI